MTRYATSLALLFAFTAGPVFAQGFGHVTGRFVYDEARPELPPLIAQGAATKDASVCAADGAIPDQSLVVDAKGGIANVFVYLRTAPETIHPELTAVPKEPVPFDQKGCVFEPHAMFVRAGQGVAVSSSDAVAHNTHTFPIKNKAVNFLLPPKPPKPVVIPTPESEILPIVVKCDIHSWMTSYWLILDHPYAVVSKTDGSFEIRNLPAGEHKFRVWQEKAGYLERSLEVVIKDGETTDLGDLKYKAKDF